MSILHRISNYNASIIDYRLSKIAQMASEYDLVLDLGYAEQPNYYLKNKHIIGVDIEKAVKPVNYNDVICADAMELCNHFKERSVDAIICGELLEHMESPISFLRGCNKVIKESGGLIISTPNPHYLGEILFTLLMNKTLFYTNHHVCLYPQRWLVRMLERAGFKNVQIYAGGVKIPYLGTVPFFRTFGHYTIAIAKK